ncbi:MAG: cadherin domain-containing protein [Roseibium sp.]|uniref:cadherin domain-containing protein n=1 Tax=Roseibium sp. TaxID=1936156 RepID=UPI003D9C1B43
MAKDTENRVPQDKPRSNDDSGDSGSSLGSNDYLHSGLLDTKDRHLDKAHDYHLDQDMGVSSEQVMSNLHLGSHQDKPLPEEELRKGTSTQQFEDSPLDMRDDAVAVAAAVEEPAEQGTETEPFERTSADAPVKSSGSSSTTPVFDRINPADVVRNVPATGDPAGNQPEPTAQSAAIPNPDTMPDAGSEEEPKPSSEPDSDLSGVSDVDTVQNAVDENAAIGTLTGITANAETADASGVTYSLDDDADGLFAIDPSTGVVTVAGELDAETAGSHDIVVRALAADGQSSTETFTITVADVNESDISAVTDVDETVNQIREDAAAGTSVGVTAQAVDADTTATVAYQVDDPRFVIDANGVVTLAEGARFDADTEGDVSFTVTATSSDGSSSSETFLINVTDINDESPSDILLSNASVDENSSAGTVVATLTATDADLDDTHVYEIAAYPSGLFEIVGNEIRVKEGALLDHETANEHVLTLTVTDAAGHSHSEDVTISVNDVNEAPVSIGLSAPYTAADFTASDGYSSASSLSDRGLEADTTVVTVSFSTSEDVDTAQTLFETGGNYYGLNIVIENGVLNVYAGEGNNVELSKPVETETDYNLALELNKETGTLTLLMSDELPLNEMTADNSLADQKSGWTDQDWDGGNSLGVGIMADHSQGHVGGDFLGQISDNGVSVYSGATLDSYMQPIVDENSTGGTVVATLSTSDPDEGDTHTYEITNDPSGFFEIVGSEIRVKEDALLDHETAENHLITVTVTDSGGLSHTEEVSIAVQDVNEAPTALTLDTANKADFTAADGYSSSTSISELGLETDNNVFAMSFTTADDVATAQTLFETGGNVYGLNVVIENGHLNIYAGDSNNLELSAEVSPGTDYSFLLELSKDAGTITLLLSDELAIEEMDESNSLAAQRSGWPDGDWDGGNNIGVGNIAGHSQGHAGGDFLGEIHDEGLSVYADATLDTFNGGALSENAAGSVVGALSVTDPDDGDTHTYTVSDDRFEVLGGTLKLKNDARIDFESEASVDVTVTATDSGGAEVSETFAVDFDDLAEDLVLSDGGVVFADAGVSETSITGGSGDDTITAHEDGGIIDGDEGDDTLIGNAGDDDLDGGTGLDTAVFSGELDDYDVVRNPDGSFTFTDTRDGAPDGTDTVRNVETFRFSDGDVLAGDLVAQDITDIADEDDTDNVISESASAGSTVGITAVADDPNVSDTVSYSVDDDRFDIDADGKVTVSDGADFDAETEGSLDVVVTAVSSDGTSSQQTFTITVADVDEFDVSAVQDVDASENLVSEDADAGTAVGVTAFAADDDVSDTVAYTVDDDRFEIAEDGTLTVAEGAAFDADTEATIDVTVTAESTDGSTSSETFIVEVGNVNDNAPTDILITGNPGNLIRNGSFEAFDVSKGSWTHSKEDPSGAWSSDGPVEVWNNLGSVDATDGDKHLELDSDGGVNSISQSVETTLGQVYDLSFDAMARSSSETSTVEVYWNDELVTRFDPETGDWESIDLQVVGTGGNDVLEFRETAEDNNSYGALLDNVSLTEIPLTIAEGMNGAVVGSVTTTDADVADKHTYTVSDNRFEIVANGIGMMVLKLKNTESLDRESSDSITLTVTTTDSGGLTYSEDVTVQIADISEFSVSAITDTDAATDALSEDAGAGDKIGVSVAATDEDATDTVSYTVDDDRFTIDADGTIAVAEGATFDAETEATVNITVTAQSSDGSTSSETFEVEIEDVDEMDVSAVTDSDTSANVVAENADAGSEVGITASASDGDISDSVSYSLDDNRFDIADDGTVTVAAGTAFDAETEDTIDVVVTVTSTDGSSSQQTFTITVADINEFTISAVQDTDASANTISEDATEGATVGVTASAGDDDATDTVSYTVDDDRFEVADDGTVTVAADASFDAETEGSINVTVTAHSSDGSTSEETFTIDVSDVNETSVSAVSDTDAADNTIAEDANEGTTVGITASASDGDVSDTVSYSVDDNRFDVADDGTVTVAADASFDAETEGSIDVTVTANSSDGSTSEETFTIDVSDVNETSVSAVSDTDASANTIAEDATEGATVGVTASADDGDVSDTVSYSVDDDRFVVAGDGTVKVAADASFDAETEGSIDVTVTARSSDGSTSEETFTIDVSDVNETSVSAVSDTDAADNTIAEDAVEGTAVGITASADDGDVSDTVSYSVDDNRFEVADDGTVTVAAGASFDFETEPAIKLTITATSSDGTSSQQVVDISVSDVAETFSLNAGQTVFVDEGVAEPTIYGTDAAETITAHDDGSRIFSGGGADTIHGGKGDDHIEFGTGADTVYGGDGNDFIDDEVGTRPSTEANLLDGGAGNDTIYGGGGGDTLLGGTGSDSLSGEEDDDTLQGDAGNDRISGGSGTDTAVYSGDRDDYDIVQNSNGSYTITDTRPDSPDGTDTVYDVEVFTFADGDVLAGDLIAEQVGSVSDTDASDNTLSENAAAGDSVGVTVSALDTNVSDSVSYSVDDARFEVSADGTVTVATGAEFDYETEPSIDVVVTATSTDGSTSEETFTINVADVAESMELEDGGVTMTDTGVAESSISGGTGNDTITAHDDGGDMDGGDGTDTVVGGAGDDTLDGGAGTDNDTLQGGEGSDTYMLRGDGRADIISDTGATGTDRIVLAENTGTEFELEDTFNAATQGIEEIDGSGVAGETLRAQRSNSEIDWDFTGVDLTGVDQIEGRDRDDSITGSAGDDNILGGAGDDTLAGSEGDDTIDGGTGTDTARFSGNLADYTVTEDAGTITIVDNRDGSPDGTDTLTNIENFEFADGTYSLGDIVNLAPTGITLTANDSLTIDEVVGGDAVVTGEIVSDGSGNQSVDHWSISHDGGDLTIDVLADGYQSGSLDSQIYLYRDNGGGDFTLVASNDDGAAGSDGSTASYDSYLSQTGLEAGTYMVVIGSYPLDSTEALDSGSDYPASGSSTGPYQITVSGDATITGLTENPASGGNWGDPGSNAVVVSSGAGEDTIAAGSELTGIETITDENSGDSFHFSFLDDGDGAFQIDSGTGSVSLAREHDASAAKSDTVTVQVTDTAGATLDKTVGIELGTAGSDRIIGTDEDDIVFGFSGDDSVDGGAGDDMLVLSGSQSDYAIYNNDDGSHTIVDTRDGAPDGTKTVSNVEEFTFADGKVAAGDLSFSSDITLLDSNATGNQLHEVADAGSEVGISVSALTPGDGALTYALSDDRFSIDADGVVTVSDHAFFDSQVESSIDLTITATAEDGKEASETFTVNVNGSYSYEMTGGLGDGSFTGSEDRSYSVDGIGGNDTITTGDQNDRIEGGSVAGNDQITGNGGRDLLFGEGGQDTISGGGGDDIIVGGSDDDTLYGGDGSDLFMHGLGDGNDVIEGGVGTAWTDVIDLGGGPGITGAGEYGTDWTVTITSGSVEKTDTENSRLELSKDAEGSIDFSDGSKIDFAQIEEIRW